MPSHSTEGPLVMSGPSSPRADHWREEHALDRSHSSVTWRPVQRLVLGLGPALLLAGCGGGSGAIATSVGQKLLEQSDLAATKLAQGDDCGALKAATALRRSSEAAILDGRIPDSLVPELRERTARLASSITCVTPSPPTKPQVSTASTKPGKGHDKGRGKGRGHGKEHGRGHSKAEREEEGDG
jgi:hypothetical protein